MKTSDWTTEVSKDVFQVIINAAMDDVKNWAFPRQLYQRSDFPGLIR